MLYVVDTVEQAICRQRTEAETRGVRRNELLREFSEVWRGQRMMGLSIEDDGPVVVLDPE